MQESAIQWPLGLDTKDLVGAGVTAIVARLDAVVKSVLHGDISCNNGFLDDRLDVKLGDFAGSAIDGLPPLVCYETSHELPDEDISAKIELFALGSTVYEIMTGSKPYRDLPDHEVSAAFSEGRYPDLESFSAFRDIIMRCWTQKYATAEEALRDVKLEIAAIKETRMARFYALLGHQTVLFPFLLTAVSLVPLVGWVKRWRSLS
ncbi:hypothetical protein BU23DRAFT_594155 [Bimuria novae-zelandiae CBS 107.79]|uniref:Protein kinase domain-containing protein n=1 Tax=Bimuria novae-zelandiae CBS 107.79 TaxID=1447943 RepID=A0A6A5UI32_9PLEO|nr:hypothetical protein BU23DRAFT_594155 [Bimuria novae-zelandiae CBS 107.79]